jgi:hypothetical protein
MASPVGNDVSTYSILASSSKNVSISKPFPLRSALPKNVHFFSHNHHSPTHPACYSCLALHPSHSRPPIAFYLPPTIVPSSTKTRRRLQTPHPHPFQFASTPGLRTRHHKARPGGHQSHDIRPEQPTVWSLGVHAGVGGYTDIAVHHYHSSGNNPLQHHHYRICKHRDPGLLLVHKANASTVHHYFALVEHEEKLLFGKEIKTARQELHHCYGLKMVYLSILFVPCGIQRQARGSRRASCYQMRQGETEVQEFRIPIRKTTSV